MTERLKDKVALITGAASGQGAYEVKLFLQEGAKVIATDVNTKLLNKHVDELKDQYGEAVLPLKLDVTQEDQWIDVVNQGVEKMGKIDILVNNAGIGVTDKTSGLENTTVADWQHFMQTNAMAHFLGMKYVTPIMKKNGGGSSSTFHPWLPCKGLPGLLRILHPRVLPVPLLRGRHVTWVSTISG